MYKGFFVNFLIVLVLGCYFVFYEYLVRIFILLDILCDDVGFFFVFLVGGIVGIIWWLVVFFGDVLVSCIWIVFEGKYLWGVWDVLWELFCNEGVFVLYKGIVFVLLRVVFESVVLFWGYELILKVINWMLRVFNLFLEWFVVGVGMIMVESCRLFNEFWIVMVLRY